MNDKIDRVDNKDSGMLSRSVTKSVQFEGPVPPPLVLLQYAEINPDYPNRIFAMAEKDQDLIHTMNKDTIDIHKMQVGVQDRAIKRGQNYALIFSVIALSCTVYLGMNGHDVLAAAVFSSVLLGIVKSFMPPNDKK